MMKNLSKDSSIRTLKNENDNLYWKNQSKNIPDFFELINKKNQRSLEKSFHFHTAKGQKSTNLQNTLNRVSSSSNFSEKKSLSRKPLDELLKSNKQPSFHGMKKSQRKQISYEVCKTETKSQKEKDQASADKQLCETSCDKNVSSFSTFQDYQSAVQKNLIFVKLRQNDRHAKTLQSEIRNSKSRSRSSKRKGLECTLYEKSLQKKINESDIKSNKKLVTVKKRFQKTEGQFEIQNQFPKKDLKKVLLKRKVKENQDFTQLESSTSINLNSTINKKTDETFQTINFTLKSLSKIQQNIRSLSRNKRTALNELNRSMSSIKGTCRNFNFESSIKRSCEKKINQNGLIKKNAASKSEHQSLLNQPIKGKKLIISEKMQFNLDKIHEKYNFITNYLSDIDIIGKLNSYDIAGTSECKWVLLLIDEVYEMIKHSRETKLKGIDYTRDYQYSSLHMIE